MTAHTDLDAIHRVCERIRREPALVLPLLTCIEEYAESARRDVQITEEALERARGRAS